MRSRWPCIGPGQPAAIIHDIVESVSKAPAIGEGFGPSSVGQDKIVHAEIDLEVIPPVPMPVSGDGDSIHQVACKHQRLTDQHRMAGADEERRARHRIRDQAWGEADRADVRVLNRARDALPPDPARRPQAAEPADDQAAFLQILDGDLAMRGHDPRAAQVADSEIDVEDLERLRRSAL